MTYELFKMTLTNELAGYFPPDTSISINEIPRNNDIILDGLTILESGFNITPTIYLQDYYEDFCQGSTMDIILKEILDSYYNYRPLENVDPSFFCDFDNVKDRIVYKLINFEKNRNLLENIPHIPYLDLAIVFYCLVSTTNIGNATILVTKKHLEYWHIEAGELLLLAQANTPFLLSSECNELSHLLNQFITEDLGQTIEDMNYDNFFPMYVLTNKSRLNGASCILYDDLLLDLANQLESDLYILPSSIHEVIVVPNITEISQMPIAYFSDMVKDVNTTQVSSEEVLSNHAYYFNRKENKITTQL